MPLWDATPEHEERPVLVVQTPGFAREAFLPLVEALRADGNDVNVLAFDCGAHDAAAVGARIAEAAAALGPDVVVVAHGVGGALALQSGADVAGWVLLSPALGVWPTEALEAAAALPVGAAVDLRTPAAWAGRDLREVLLGPVPDLACAPAPLVAEVQGWVREGRVPLDLGAVEASTWVAVSLGDDVATVEGVVEASRALPDRRLVRLGLNGWHRQDFAHAELLAARPALRFAIRAARRLR